MLRRGTYVPRQARGRAGATVVSSTAKFLHVVVAALWLGGGVMLMVLQLELTRARDMAAMGGVGRAATKLSRTYFMPLAIVTLLLGIWAAAAGDWDFGSVWIGIGFGVVVVNAALAMAVIGPTGRRMGAAMEAGDTAAIPALRMRILAATTAANLLLLLAFWAMVVKPG
jgi:uncharacterized membrane protein